MRMKTEYKIAFDAERCMSCYGCVTACKVWRERPYGINCRRIERLWINDGGSMPRLRFASVNCQHCADPACVGVCVMNAITKSEDGIVKVDESKCVGCRECLRVCPFNIPQFLDTRKMVKCDLCEGRFDMATEEPPCVATCPTRALKLVKVSAEEKAMGEAALLKLLASDTLKK